MTAYATRLENSTDTAPRVRLADAASLQHNGGALNARSGLRPDDGGVVTVVAGTMGVQVAPFSGWVDGGSSDAQGGYWFVLDSAATLTLSDGHASLSRTDTVVAQVRDDTYDGSGFTDATVVVVEGTPGAGAPTLPTSCVPLRNVTVPAGLSAGTGGLSSSNLGSDRRAWTVAAGGILPVASIPIRDALGAKAGQAVYRTASSTLEVFNGTDWDAYKKDDGLEPPQFGEKTGPTIAAGGNGDATVTFDTPFPSIPTVTATTWFQWCPVSIVSVSTTQVVLRWRNFDTSSSGSKASWIAMCAS